MTDDNYLHALGSPLPARDSLLLLDMGEIHFFVQGDVISLLPINQMQHTSAKLECGSVEFEAEQLPVFYFNDHLQLLSQAPEHCAAVVLMVAGDSRFGIACSSLQKYTGPAPMFYSVPVSMSSRKQPFSEFAVIENRAVGLVSAEELLRVARLRGASVANQRHAQRLRSGAATQ